MIFFPCLDRNGERKASQELSRKLKELEDKVWNLNAPYTKALHNGIKALQEQRSKNAGGGIGDMHFPQAAEASA